MDISAQQRELFLETLWSYYAAHRRDQLPWRQPASNGSFDPYKILVSELMLQQTQVARVLPKYEAFLTIFPSAAVLASADLGAVLRAWQGLGYNRRAKFLWQTAITLQSLDQFPDTVAGLVALPGVGVNTAGAIMAYAYSKPILFIETNVRTVYLHHFFKDQSEVHDNDIKICLEQTLDQENPREFYWALMDYGSHLKTTVGNANTASSHYSKQSTFHGSRRQIRGQVLRLLTVSAYSADELREAIPDERLEAVLDDLVQEGLIRNEHGTYRL